MRYKKALLKSTMVLTAVAVTLLIAAVSAAAQTESVLHNFSNNNMDSFHPVGALISDAAGNLYGTGGYGGPKGFSGGTVYELVPQTGGGWTEKILHPFGNGLDGANPWSELIFDGAGNLYGTTVNGGALNKGTVYELSPATGGGWTEKILHSFGSGSDGFNPYGGLVMDAAGNLYGTTTYGGTHFTPNNYSGIAFELSPAAGGHWTEKILHNFGAGKDGGDPAGTLILDSTGNLYGTTYFGGASSPQCNPNGTFSCGTAFELSPVSGGGWKETILHSFGHNASDGRFPYAGMIFDAAGNLYGTAQFGGTTNAGTVFELSPAGGGVWTETTLLNFTTATTGLNPAGQLVFDTSGNLYSTTSGGGTFQGGTLFKLSPTGGGSWAATVLHNFAQFGDGQYPESGVLFDPSGNMYGTTTQGGTKAAGTVFKFVP